MYTDQKEIKISVLTWNCAGNLPPEDYNIFKELINDELRLSDIYIIGL